MYCKGIFTTKVKILRVARAYAIVVTFGIQGDPVYLNSSDAPLPTVRWGVATSKGQRQQMEDAHMGVPVLDLPDSCPFHQNSSFFGVCCMHAFEFQVLL